MFTRIAILGLVFFASASAVASEALKYAGAYECQATAINDEMVKACATMAPQLATRASEAYTKWLARNSTKAEVAARACMAQLRKLSEDTADENEAEYLQKQIDVLKHEIIDSFKTRISKEGPGVCEDALRQLETGSGGMDFK